MKRKCLILKDAQGGLCGYLIQEDGRIVLNRRSGVDRSGMLVCFDSLGGVRRLPMEERTQEMQWTDEGRILEMVYGETGGELIFSSGEDAKRAYLSSGRETENTRAQGVRAVPEEENVQNEPPPEAKTAQRREQETRWPPPPCMVGARYSGGVWRIREEG